MMLQRRRELPFFAEYSASSFSRGGLHDDYEQLVRGRVPTKRRDLHQSRSNLHCTILFFCSVFTLSF